MGVVGYGVGSGAGADTSNGLHLFSCKVGINSSSVYIRRTDISTSGEVTLSMGSTNTCFKDVRVTAHISRNSHKAFAG